nr:hypothetical protein [Halopiger goleimassiliensis]
MAIATESSADTPDVSPDDRSLLEAADSLVGKSKGDLVRLAGRLRDRREELNRLVGERADRRDELNERVQEHKEKRDELNRTADQLYGKIGQLKADLDLDGEASLEELESELEELEHRQQTRVLSADEEASLVERIEETRERIRERRDRLEKADLLELKRRAEAAREEASEHHERVLVLADRPQDHHERMIEAYREADEIHDRADEAHEAFVAAQDAADAHHEAFVRVQRRLEELDEREHVPDDESGEEAAELFEQFKEGDALTEDDLRRIQGAIEDRSNGQPPRHLRCEAAETNSSDERGVAIPRTSDSCRARERSIDGRAREGPATVASGSRFRRSRETVATSRSRRLSGIAGVQSF